MYDILTGYVFVRVILPQHITGIMLAYAPKEGIELVCWWFAAAVACWGVCNERYCAYLTLLLCVLLYSYDVRVRGMRPWISAAVLGRTYSGMIEIVPPGQY